MMTGITSASSVSRIKEASAPHVWERVWQTVPSTARDDYLLGRERNGPRWAEIMDRLISAFGRTKGLRTIELGSGRGDLSVLLAERGAEVTLLDQSGAVLDQARARFQRLGLSAEYRQGDMFDPPADVLGHFDMALSSGVIEHFVGGDRTRAISAHADVLRPGGMVTISVPHASCPPYRLWKWYLEVRRRWPYGFERPFSKKEIRYRAGEAGLASVDTKAMALWHSISAHWLRDVLRFDVDWANKRSHLDKHWGLILLLFGRKPADCRDE